MTRTLGLLTLGQSPREDVTPAFRWVLGPDVQVLERGALDGLAGNDLDALRARPPEPGLETRLRSGAAIGLHRPALQARLEAAARDLAGACDLVLLLCSGSFPDLEQACPWLVQPIHLLRGAVRALARDRLLGVVGPASDLLEAPAHWAPYAPRVLCAPASPYEPLTVTGAAARSLASAGAQVILLDDLGFGLEHRAAATAAGVPVLCASTLAARLVQELFG
jgi:protein AroM